MAMDAASMEEILMAVMGKVWQYQQNGEYQLIMIFSDEVFGRCCGGGKSGGGCGGYVGGKPAAEHYEDGLFGTPRVTNWTRGQPAEVYWASRAGHRGGYAYRLCKVSDAKYWEVTEDCFREGHLNFYGNL